MSAKLTVISIFFSNVRKYKTAMTWAFGILEKILSQWEMKHGGDPRNEGIYNDTSCLSMWGTVSNEEIKLLLHWISFSCAWIKYIRATYCVSIVSPFSECLIQSGTDTTPGSTLNDNISTINRGFLKFWSVPHVYQAFDVYICLRFNFICGLNISKKCYCWASPGLSTICHTAVVVVKQSQSCSILKCGN